MNKFLRFAIDNICPIFLAIGCVSGIAAFFINWETFTDVSTNGWDFAFGNDSETWYSLIGNNCYIPLIVFICSILSTCTFVWALHKNDHMWKVMMFCTICGTVMLLSMAALSMASMCFDGKTVYFANYIGTGTRLAWTASVMIIVGGGMYIASQGRDEDGQ